MSISGIHGQLLEVTVVGGFRLKNTEWISRQDPYVCIEYGSTKFRTRTCTDGGKNPVFQEKFTLNLIEGLREINVVVWNSNTLSSDDFIGAGKVQIQDALSRGYDDRAWSLQTKTGRYAGEVKLIMHYANADTNARANPTSFMPYGAPSQQPQPLSNYYRPPPSSALPPPVPTYQPQPYSSFSSYTYPPNIASYTPPPPHMPHPHEAYPPQPYPPPPQPYPPPPQPYSQYPQSGYYTGAYPPPSY